MQITFRSIILGCVLIPINNMFIVTTEVMWQSGYPSVLSLFCNVIFILFWLMLGNEALKRWAPRWVFNPAELLVVYVMLSISTAICGHDNLQVLLPAIAHLYRFNALEGRYAEVVPYVPTWLVLTDPTALESAHSGQESMYTWANLRPWIQPLGWWFLFTIALCAVMWGLILLFRKQWTEHEKLAYPIIRTPMIMATEPLTLLKSKPFWIAFSLAGGLTFMNGMHVLYPTLPHIPLVNITNILFYFPDRPWNAIGSTPVNLYPFAVGMCFFMPLDLTFSCWFFVIAWRLQRVLASHLGMHGMPGFPFQDDQVAGGYYAIAAVAIWFSRRHLWNMCRAMIGRRPDGLLQEDVCDARTGGFLIAAGLLFLYAFCAAAGMSWHIIALFFLLYFLVSIGVTRVRAELGPPTTDTYGISPHLQLIHILGAGNLTQGNPRDVAMFGLLGAMARTFRGHPMPHGLEAYRIAERLHLDRRRLFHAMWIAIALGTIFTFWATLYVYNKYGISAQVLGIPQGLGEEVWGIRVNTWMTAPEHWQPGPSIAVVIGFLCALGMMVLRGSLAWFPLHPVGFAMSGVAGASMDCLWMSLFFAWLIKVIILKYGGPKIYTSSMPFFLGLILGDFIIGTGWNIYGVLMGVKVYHFWPY